ncbi:NnrS family protein [Palleronia caenipelagi]|uniref:NnrS family protein n=1 Tax=Palleronia caenipelagi TaxID=2489174 RepID=A0A547QA18_9RHOB|nr:NnrS family protein [Palleronia caenipelagi]TRD23238.1 NnrS family protein [Palleronia caenipelagi]
MRKAIGVLFGDGFRVFFVGAALFGLISAVVWELWLGAAASGTVLSVPPGGSAPQLWHAHEMIFGYAGAALGGFFLTAVPNWTGTEPPGRRIVMLAAGLWLAGRLAVWSVGALPPTLVAVIDLSFLPLLGAEVLRRLLKRPKPQNFLFIGLLVALWLSNLSVHLDWMGAGGPGAETGLRAGLLTLCAMIGILGGRVTPAFTRNAMTQAGVNRRQPVSHKPLEILAISSALALPVLILFGAPMILTGAVAILSGVAQIARLAGWGGVWTLRKPILWSLHLSFAMLGAGLILWGLAALGFGDEIGALHLLGIGAVGGMTLAVMSRAILGHTGRPLVAPATVALAYGLIALAALIRWAAPLVLPQFYWTAALTSGALWIGAMALFLAALLPLCLTPRDPSAP